MAKQARGKRETPVAVHSYLHLVRKNGVHPYIKRLSAERPRAASPWTVPDLCAAHDAAPGGGVIAIIELGGGWTQADVTQFFANANLLAPNITDVSFMTQAQSRS